MDQTSTTLDFDLSIIAAVHLITELYAPNTIPIGEMPSFIRSVRRELMAQPSSGIVEATAHRGTAGDASDATAEHRAVPAVAIEKSITRDAIISLENGKPYRTMTRHLAGLGLTPSSYREKWGLPSDYPMVAPAYSEKRAALAKDMGLGRKAQANGHAAADPIKGLVAEPDTTAAAEPVSESVSDASTKSQARRASRSTKQPAEATA